MSLKKYLGLERRSLPRHTMGVEVEFYVWDAAHKKPRTGKVSGRLTEISLEGACLQTNSILIDGHHILRDNDLEGQTPLVVDLPPSTEGVPRSLKAQVIWYNRNDSNRPFQFDVGLKFNDISEPERQHLRDLIKSTSTD
jgi:hypothetical protein